MPMANTPMNRSTTVTAAPIITSVSIITSFVYLTVKFL